MIPYVSLHNHTSISLMNGLMTPAQLFARAKEFGQTAVAVTDHGSLAAVWDCLKLQRSTGIKFIPGCELYFVDDVADPNSILRHIIVLATNAVGYRNLLLLQAEAYDNRVVAFKKSIPRLDWRMLEKYREGLIVTSACGNGILGQSIMANKFDLAVEQAKKLKDIFEDNFALELQPHNLQRKQSAYSGPINQQKINLALKKIGEDVGIRCIVANNSHYLNKEDHLAHDVLVADGCGQPLRSGARLRYDKPDFHYKCSIEAAQYFLRHKRIWGEEFIKSLFENTIYLADKCEPSEWIDPKHSNPSGKELPEFPVKDEEDYPEFLKWKAEQKASKEPSPMWKDGIGEDAQFFRYRTNKALNKYISIGKIPEEDRQECIDNCLEEFDVFEFRGFSSYMLIVAGFLQWCNKNSIKTGIGRGSVGGSLTAYVNGIHGAYPKKYGLIFSRFLNKKKAAYPDIDCDISPTGREKLQNYLRQKYGEDHVAHVSNVNTITPKVYARDIARVFEFGGDRSKAAEIGNEIADSIPAEMKTVKQALEHAPLFAEWTKVHPELAEFVELIHGVPRAWSTHAGGLVINKRPLRGLVPLRRDANGAIATEWDKEKAEEAGIVKFDTLGLETLSIIEETQRLVKNSGKVIPDEFDYEQEDEKAYNLISEGNTFGIFQLASVATPVCKMLKPRNIDDIALVTALIRPGAKEIIKDFLKVRNGEKPLELTHPFLEKALKGTNGFGVFEECLMWIAAGVGWDLHKADALRKMTKAKGKYPEKVKKIREEFIADAQKNQGVDEETAEKIWTDHIENFGSYGFNKSHATLYSMVSFETACYKANYPIQFLTANLKSEVKSNAKQAKENILKIKTEIRDLGVRIVPPDINQSDTTYKIVSDDKLMTGLDALKYMGKDAIPELLAKRPFTSFKDLMYRVDSSKVRAPTIQALAASGSLDSFNEPRHMMYLYCSDYRNKLRSHIQKMERALNRKMKKPRKRKNEQLELFEQREREYEAAMQEPVNEVTPELVQQWVDEFEYPWPEKEKAWNIRETFAMEEFYMGEGISGTVFERYNGFLKAGCVKFPKMAELMPYEYFSDDEKTDRKANTTHISNKGLPAIKGIITHIFSFTVKKEDSKIFGQRMARITVQDPWGNDLSVVAFPETWEYIQERVEKELSGGKTKLEPGLAISFNGLFQWENSQTYSFIIDDILDYKEPPTLPTDRKSKKVKMPRGIKLKKEELEEMQKEELAVALEDEMVDSGISPIDDDDDDEIYDFS